MSRVAKQPRIVPLAITLCLLAVHPVIAGENGNAPPNDSETGPEVTELTYYGCRGHYGNTPVSRFEVAPYLPEGFRPAPWFGAGLFDVTGQTGGIVVLAQECTRVVADTGVTFFDAREIEIWAFVQAPQQFAHPGLVKIYTLGMMTDHPDLAAVYEDWDLDDDALADISFDALWGDDQPGTMRSTLTTETMRLEVGHVSSGNQGFVGEVNLRSYVGPADGAITHYIDTRSFAGPKTPGISEYLFESGGLFLSPAGTASGFDYVRADHEAKRVLRFTPLEATS